MSVPEFHVTDPSNSRTFLHSFIRDALAMAAELALLRGVTTYVDVVVWDRAAAVRWGGDDAGEAYDEDPDASVFERIEVKVNSLGRVP